MHEDRRTGYQDRIAVYSPAAVAKAGVAAGERPRPVGLPVLRADERFVDALAAALADRVADRLQDEAADDGYLNPEAAGRYICVPRRRIHELTSAGLLVPDGHDGRTPLYRRPTLDRYVQGSGDRS